MRLIVIALALLPALAWAQDKPTVIDGDTVAVGKKRYRIVGLDTPETYQPQCPEEARLGYAAAGRAQHLINARAVRVVPLGRIDKYYRQLARVYVGKDELATLLIQEGLARAYDGGKRQPWCPAGKPREAAY